MKAQSLVISVVTFLLMSGCSSVKTVCPADVSFTLEPTTLTLQPLETAQPTFKVFTCGGTIEEDIIPIWISENPEIAIVDADTGLIKAIALGDTKVRVSENDYITGGIITIHVAANE